MENAPKQYLYHKVPEDMTPNEEGRDVLYPLNMLKEKFPGLYEVHMQKYHNPEYEDPERKRKNIPNRLIPTLEQAAWGDVVQLTPVHPAELRKALDDAGFESREMKFYQIDPELLDPEKTTIYLFREDVEKESPESYTKYDPKNLAEHSAISERTKEHYKQMAAQGLRPLLFVGVPHVFHKGPIDVSNFPVITV